MATEEAKTTAEPKALFAALAEPFHPAEIKWRVTHTTRDGSRGAVIAYADPRAYTDRLNQLFTPTGWTRSYDIATLSAVTRTKKDKQVQTGKVLVTCTLTIQGLGCHTGSGEEWADEDNAMTAAEAQAFKRAASCFGLGRYLYNFSEMWVPLNEYRQPIHLPDLPQWALPSTQSQPASSRRSTTAQRGPIDQKTTTKIESFQGTLGEPIYLEILRRIAHVRRAGDIPNTQLQAEIAHRMERAVRGIEKAHSLAEQVGDTAFVAMLDRLGIRPATAIPNLEALKSLVGELEREAAHVAA